MVAFLTQLLLAIRSRFTRRARLEAENLLLRRTARSPTTQVLDARETVEYRSPVVGVALPTVPITSGRDPHRSAGDRDPLAPTLLPRLLALEVPPGGRPSKN